MRNSTFKWRKLLAMLLCVSMFISLFPVNVFASGINDISDDTSIVEPGTYTFDEHGHLICDECGQAEGHLEDCSSYISTATDSNAIGDEEIKECECGATGDNHSIDCELYIAPDDNCDCDLTDGTHDIGCNLYVPATDCDCDVVDGIHNSDCPLYEEKIDEKPGSTDSIYDVSDDTEVDIICTCETETEIHDITCAMYEAPVIDFEYLNNILNFDEFYEIVYNNPNIIETLTNNEKNELLLKIDNLFGNISEPNENDVDKYNYLTNLINSYIIIICEECAQEGGEHLESCSYWVCSECGNHEHSLDCSYYVANCSECGQGMGEHLEECPNWVCSECGEHEHTISCSQYIEKCSECGEINGFHLETCSNYVKKCSECGGINDIHTKDCSLWVCDECGAHEHLETCSKFVKICEECNGKNDEHLKTCSLYVDNRTFYEKLLDSTLEEMYYLLTNSENSNEVKSLTTEEIDEVIWQVGLIADDEDLEIEVLMILYKLPNAPDNPWKTLETSDLTVSQNEETVYWEAGVYNGRSLTSGTYILNGNVSLASSNIVIPANTDVIIDLNGYVLGGTNNSNVIIVKGTLTIVDSSWDLEETSRPAHYGIFNSKATWTKSGVSYAAGTWDYISDNIDDVEIPTVIWGGIITKGNSQNGSGIHVESGATLNFESGTVAGNKSSALGGAIYGANGSNINIMGGSFIYNMANGGGGVYIGKAAVTLENCYIAHNIASASKNLMGGGLYLNSTTIDIENVTIYSNHAYTGGGIYMINSNVNLVNSLIDSNKGTSGGGINNSKSKLNILSGKISNNSATTGGGLYTDTGFGFGSPDCSVHSGGTHGDCDCPVIELNEGNGKAIYSIATSKIDFYCGTITSSSGGYLMVFDGKTNAENHHTNMDVGRIRFKVLDGTSFVDNVSGNQVNVNIVVASVINWNMNIPANSYIVLYIPINGIEFDSYNVDDGSIIAASGTYKISKNSTLTASIPASNGLLFDLAAGNVEIDDDLYVGYIFVDGIRTLVSGTHNPDNKYYIYQSNGDVNQSFDENGIPIYDRVTWNGESWSSYITNNTDIAGVVANWMAAATDKNRVPTANKIVISGESSFNVTIDNIWSTYVNESTGRQDSGLAFLSRGGNLVLGLKGDNRFSAIHTNANSGSYIDKFIFENADDINNPGSVTVASYDGVSNHYNSVIGGNDGEDTQVVSITINGGVIYAGAQTGDNCSGIGGGGNQVGYVTINGGTVTSVVNSSGTAIGGGIGESAKGGNAEITITGGSVYAYNFGFVSVMSGVGHFIPGAAIGGGSSCKDNGNSSTNIDISGGYVYAQSMGGAAIGGGSSTMKAGGPATITISGDAIVEAQSIGGTATNGDTIVPGVSIGGGTAGIEGTSNGGNITLTIDGGTLYTGSIGGGNCANDKGTIGSGTVTINRGSMRGQVVMGAGSSSKNTFTMTGGVIDNDLSPVAESIYPYEFIGEFGGAVYLEYGDVLIDGGIIKNTNSTLGGAVYIDGGNFVMNSGKMYGLSADYGGAVYINSGNFTMNGGSIYNNTADYGGAIAVSNGDFTMNGGSIYNNDASYGGALYMDGGNFDIYNGEFADNSAIDGGAAYISGADEINIYNGTFDSNEASNNGGAIYATSSDSDIVINIFDGIITNNSAGNHGGAIGASASGSYAAILNIGEEDCLGANHILHDDNDCPVIDNNTASHLGGAFCLHGNADALAVNIYCGDVVGNIAIRNPGSNSINQGGGSVTVWGGNIDPGIMVGGGTYTDNRIDSDQITLRFWSNYPGGPADPHLVEVTVSVTVVFPLDTYVWGGHELSGWATAANASGLYIPAQGQYAIPSNDSGYLDFYAVWDADTSYIVYIPESVDIDTETGIGTIDISADINYFKKNSNLNIFINSDFKLENNGNSNKYLEYKLTSSEFGDLHSISNNGIAATFQYNNALDKALKLILLLDSNNKIYSDGYSDVITFTIEYEEINEL